MERTSIVNALIRATSLAPEKASRQSTATVPSANRPPAVATWRQTLKVA